MRFLLAAIFLCSFYGFSQEGNLDDERFVVIENNYVILIMRADEVDEDLDKYLDLFLLIDGEPAPVQVAGHYSFDKGNVMFKSQYPLEEGKWFEARFNYPGAMIPERFQIPVKEKPQTPLAEVQEIYPVENVVPSNILFFHVRFTERMSEDQEAYKFVNLVLNDSIIPQAWRHKAFWLDEGRVLVLMIHPARVKRGIHFLSDEDDLFKTGNKISVQVTNELKDNQGRKIKSGYSEEFLVGERDTIIPKILFDQFTLPRQTGGYMKLVFSEPMNYASIIDGIQFYDPNGKEKTGSFIEESDNVFRFKPLIGKWEQGTYKIVFTKVVADLANNRLNRPFEIEDVNDKLLDEDVIWEFEVK